MFNYKTCIFLVLTLMLFGCAGNQKQILEYRSMVQKKDYDAALAYMKSDVIYKDEQSKLLKFLELGTLHLHKGEYFQALTNFDKAKDLSDKLFTVSVSKKLAGTLGNESSDNYSGERFERSLIRYFSILAHYNLYEKGIYEAHDDIVRDENGNPVATNKVAEVVLDESKKRFHLTAAKSVLLEWNSMLEDLKKTTAGEVTYKDDLLAKFVGAVLHEKADSSGDKQIALNLYKESKNTLFRYYNSYESFNTRYKEFNSDYSKLPSIDLKQIELKYVTPTQLNREVISFADEQTKNFGKKDKDNVYLIWHEGLISSKEVKSYDFPIGLTAATVTVGTQADFVTFARGALVIVDQVAPKIQFEMPTIPYRVNNEIFELVVKKAGKVIGSRPAVLVDPLSEMAYYTLESKAVRDLAFKGTRVAGKHLAALVASYITYRNLKDKTGDAIAFMSGTAAYNLASKGIAESEKADLRSWLTLPNQVRMSSFKLSPGDYELFAVKTADKSEVSVGKFTVSDKEKVALKSFF